MFKAVQQVGKQYFFGMITLVIVIGLANSIGLWIIVTPMHGGDQNGLLRRKVWSRKMIFNSRRIWITINIPSVFQYKQSHTTATRESVF